MALAIVTVAHPWPKSTVDFVDENNTGPKSAIKILVSVQLADRQRTDCTVYVIFTVPEFQHVSNMPIVPTC